MSGPHANNGANIRVRIKKRLSETFVIDVDFALPLHGVTALFGPSGSGKTSILDTIAGLRNDVGDADVIVDGETWQRGDHGLPPWERSIGYVFQGARLLPDRSVASNLDFALQRGFPDGPDKDSVIELLGIAQLLDRTPETLSAGEQQRVAIARALLRNPRLLLLDEPLSNLDEASAASCMSALLKLREATGLPMLYVSHKLEEVHALADQVIVLDGGKVRTEGPLLDLASSLESGLADGESAAGIVEVLPGSETNADGLSPVTLDGQILWISGTSTGGSQRLRVPARDVSVCRERPSASSILNILEVSLEEFQNAGEAHCLLRLKLDDQYLLARITQRSRRELNLQLGDRLFAQVKSTALLGDRGTS